VNLAYKCKYEKNTGEYSIKIQIINENDKLYTNNKQLWGIILQMGKMLSVASG
jgi:hypothetical protein